MYKVMMGWAVCALLAGVPTAAAEPAAADVWIGVDGTLDGFLIDTATGEVWMTGVCLKPLGTAAQTGSVWRVDLSEMVSVGRGRTLLQQAFTLDIAETAPAITVSNPDRGGEQAIANVARVDCATGEHCRRAAGTPDC